MTKNVATNKNSDKLRTRTPIVRRLSAKRAERVRQVRNAASDALSELIDRVPREPLAMTPEEEEAILCEMRESQERPKRGRLLAVPPEADELVRKFFPELLKVWPFKAPASVLQEIVRSFGKQDLRLGRRPTDRELALQAIVSGYESDKWHEHQTPAEAIELTTRAVNAFRRTLGPDYQSPKAPPGRPLGRRNPK